MLCKNMNELEKELKKRINIALATDVTDTVRDVMTDHIIQDVYDEYSPVSYVRRLNESGSDNPYNPFDDTDNTGLLDPDNIIAKAKDCALIVKNNTLGSHYYYTMEGYGHFEWHVSKNYNKPIAGVIETGRGYDVGKRMKPRPFIENTYNDLVQNNYAVDALKRGLRKQGLEVK